MDLISLQPVNANSTGGCGQRTQHNSPLDGQTLRRVYIFHFRHGAVSMFLCLPYYFFSQLLISALASLARRHSRHSDPPLMSRGMQETSGWRSGVGSIGGGHQLRHTSRKAFTRGESYSAALEQAITCRGSKLFFFFARY